MKWLYVAIGILVGLPLAFFGLIYAASELGGEVVVLHRPAADGSVDRVRLWIVEDEKGTWIEHGGADAVWLSQLAENPLLTVERNGAPRQYHAVTDPDACTLYQRLRREQYGWADQLVALGGGEDEACTSVPVRLEVLSR